MGEYTRISTIDFYDMTSRTKISVVAFEILEAIRLRIKEKKSRTKPTKPIRSTRTAKR